LLHASANSRTNGKHLIEGGLIGDKLCTLQTITGGSQGGLVHGQTLTYGVVGVVTEALAIGDGYKEEVEVCGLMG